MMRGQKNDWKFPRKVRIASATTPGRASGRMTSRKSCSGDAPSISAASSKLRGMVTMNWRRRNVPKAENAMGRIRPRYVFTKPSFTMIW